MLDYRSVCVPYQIFTRTRKSPSIQGMNKIKGKGHDHVASYRRLQGEDTNTFLKNSEKSTWTPPATFCSWSLLVNINVVVHHIDCKHTWNHTKLFNKLFLCHPHFSERPKDTLPTSPQPPKHPFLPSCTPTIQTPRPSLPSACSPVTNKKSLWANCFVIKAFKKPKTACRAGEYIKGGKHGKCVFTKGFRYLK